MSRVSGESMGVMAPILTSPKCDGRGGTIAHVCGNLEDSVAACGVS